MQNTKITIELSPDEVEKINSTMLGWDCFRIMAKVQERILHELEKEKIPNEQGKFEFE